MTLKDLAAGYKAVLEQLSIRIVDLIPAHPEILGMRNAFELFNIDGFDCSDLSPSLAQAAAALAGAQKAWFDSLLPWPTDAAIIVCSTPEQAHTDKMESVNLGKCRACGCDIVYDSYTYRRTDKPEITCGRPIEFLCLETCFPKYNFGQVTITENHTPEFKAVHPG